MAAVLSKIVCVSFLLVAIQGDSEVYIVEPTDSCLGNNNCSLMYYASHPDRFFHGNNATFRFLPGDHQLCNSTLVHWGNVSDLTVTGVGVGGSEMEARVVCKGEQSGGFSFYNITNLTIENLSWFNCSSRSWKYDELVMAVEIIGTHNLRMNNVCIQETAGYGLSMTDVYGHSNITSITIELGHNTAQTDGGNFAYYCSNQSVSNNSTLYVFQSLFRYGRNNRVYDSPGSGIFIHINCSINLTVVFDRVTVIHNKAKHGGNVWIEYWSNVTLWTVSISFLNSNISYGFGDSGGGLCMIAIAGCTNCFSHSENGSTILAFEYTHFENNRAIYNGGAVYLRLHQNPFVAVGKIWFTKNCTFKNNSLVFPTDNSDSLRGGVGVHIITFILPVYHQHQTVFFEVSFSDCTFENNYVQEHVVEDDHISVPRTGALYMENARLVNVKDCHFIKNRCTGIVALNSNIMISGKNVISENRGVKGGGMFFCAGGLMHLHNGSELNITQNHAVLSGGGIYVESECSPAVSYCFFQVDNVNADSATLNHTKVYLANNTARSGTALFGGLIDDCVLFDRRGENYNTSYPSRIFNHTFVIHHHRHDLTYISSDPMYVGFCIINSTTEELSTGNCPLNITRPIKPGGQITVPVVIMGQRYGLLSGVVLALCVNCTVDKEHYSQYVNASSGHTQLTYTIYPANSRNVSLVLVAEDYYFGYPTYTYNPSYIHLSVEECPLGFKKEGDNNYICACIANIECNITAQTLHRKNPHWIGYMKDYQNDTTDIIVHKFCPLGYCVDKDLWINATYKNIDQDKQCSHYRTGLLCGSCQPGYSLGFGSSQCLPDCYSQDVYLRYIRVVGLIVVCGVAGIMLVVLLTLLNLTVAEGTLNGLIFYANIIQVNMDIFFPPETHARPWAAFIAWLNLDFGVTVCFYGGMDAYEKTWLQFIFPLYLWLISGGIIYFSRKFKRVAQLTGKNAVKVLATLFLLSFGKLLRNVIAVSLVTNVHSHDWKINISVWLHDANIHYLHGKHIILFIVSVLVGVVVLLYAFLLTFIQCLRRAPSKRMCGWVQRLKPLLDAYTGPYKTKYHFWTGLLLLVRIFLFLSFTFNYDNEPALNFMLIIIATTVLMIAIQPGIYCNLFVGLLENSMYANLILFSAVMMFSVGKGYSRYETIAAWFFGGWALLTFLGIVVYHAFKHRFGFASCGQLGVLWKRWFSVHARESTAIRSLLIQRSESEESNTSDELEENERELDNPLTVSSSRFRESLIGSL